MGDDDATPVINPVDVEQAIRECSARIARGVMVVTEREREAAEARRAFDVAFAQATLAADAGNAEARKAQAQLATATEREQAEVAEIAFRHAQRQAKALEKELDAWRSLGASVRSMYTVAGTGEGA